MRRDEPRRRKVLRAQGFDYSTPGYYFVTICVQDKSSVFGDVVDAQVVLNHSGQIASDAWNSLPTRFPGITLDAAIIMPNHFHGLIGISVHPDVAAQFIAPLARRSHSGEEMSIAQDAGEGAINCAATQKLASLGNIIRVFKAVSTDRIRRSGLPAFSWQSNYYDRIVRNERELNRIRAYIDANPGNWHRDQENPAVLCRGDVLRRPA